MNAQDHADEAVERLGVVMAKAIDLVLAELVPNAPVKITVLVRNEEDSQSHAFVSNDTLDGAMQGLAELAMDPGSQLNHVNAHGMARLQ